MVTFTFGDEIYEIPKFKLREVGAAAPFIDRVTAKRGEIRKLASGTSSQEEIAERLAETGTAMEGLMGSMGDIVRVIAVGVLHAKKEYPYSVASIEAQAELIEAEIGMEDLAALNQAFEDIAREAGMLPAGPLPAPVEGAKEASPTKSAKS